VLFNSYSFFFCILLLGYTSAPQALTLFLCLSLCTYCLFDFKSPFPLPPCSNHTPLRVEPVISSVKLWLLHIDTVIPFFASKTSYSFSYWKCYCWWWVVDIMAHWTCWRVVLSDHQENRPGQRGQHPDLVTFSKHSLSRAKQSDTKESSGLWNKRDLVAHGQVISPSELLFSNLKMEIILKIMKITWGDLY
jgi:hypothetical protein